MRHRSVLAAALALAVPLTGAALAEPVAVRFDDQTFEVELRDLEPALPPFWLSSETAFAGAGAMETGFQIDLLDENGDQTCAVDLIQGRWNAVVPWLPGPWCVTELPSFTVMVSSNDDCPPCDWTPGYPTAVHFRGPPRAFFLRYRADAGSPDWTYGWVVAQAMRLINLGCVDLCGEFGTTVPYANLIAAGFSDEPGTPIPAGAGLCASDLTFDGVLDLADLQAFVQNFLDRAALADRNADGVYDLADVQAFVSGFVAGCP